jgi:hypothetical protein
MKLLTIITMVLSLCLGIASFAHADETWTVYADSTLAGHYGYLVTFADESGSGDTIFITLEAGHQRFMANREFGETGWNMFPEGWYVSPGAGDIVGSSWSTIDDDFERPSKEYFEEVEPYTGPLGTLVTARCPVRPNSEPGTFTEVRYWSDGVGLVADSWPDQGTDLLTDFNIVGGTGYFPMAVGNTWSYGWLEEATPVDGAPLALNLLHACSPNPFNPQTKISFEMAADSHASLRIFDAAGHLVKTLVDEQRSAGMHSVSWNGQDESGRSTAAGVYLYRFEAGESVQTRRMTLVK